MDSSDNVTCDPFTFPGDSKPIPVDVTILNVSPLVFYLVSGLLLAFGALAVGLRFVATRKFGRKSWFDDWLTLPALIIECAIAGVVIWGASTDSLRDPITGKCDAIALKISRQIHWALAWLATFAIGFMKLSLLFFYRRLFYTPGSKGSSFDQDTKRLIVLVILWMVGFGFATCFPCGIKFNLIWQLSADKTAICYPQTAILFASACSDFIIDGMILLCPVAPLWSTRMMLRQKLLIATVFLASSPAIAIAACRAIFYYDFNVNTYPTYMVFFNLIEVGISLITCCLPALWVYHTVVHPNRALRKLKSTVSGVSHGDRSETLRGDSISSRPPTIKLRDIPDAQMTTHIRHSQDLERPDVDPEHIVVHTEILQGGLDVESTGTKDFFMAH